MNAPQPSVAAAGRDWPRFLSVKDLADYLNLNEKKVYALANDGVVPGTKVTGKWLFPRELIDQWLINSSHGGLLTDRLVLAGSDDPLLARSVGDLAAAMEAAALVSYTCTGTRLGLELLARQRADACALHWGPAEESRVRHPALLRHFPHHRQWVLLRAFHREQGLMLGPRVEGDATITRLLRSGRRWCVRQEGAGSQRFLVETLAAHGGRAEELPVVSVAASEREAASQVARGLADVAPGTRSAASEFGLDFIAVGWEAFDLALPRGVYFRTLFQRLLDCLNHPDMRALAESLGGYDFAESGQMVWGQD